MTKRKSVILISILITESFVLGLLVESTFNFDLTGKIQDSVYYSVSGMNKEEFNEAVDNETKALKEVFRKYPTPDDLHFAIQNGTESFDDLPRSIQILMAGNYGYNLTEPIEVKGSLVVANP